ncbi:MAG: hypothetical protein WCG68_04020 [Actinomycetes bacterium]
MRPTPYVASLRVYEPLSAFEPADRLRWQSIDISEQSYVNEEAFALHRTVVPEPPAGRPDGVHILDIEGERYVAPWSTATRCWAALDNFKDSLPSSVVPYFVSPAMEDVITAGVDLLDDKVPHILNETWVIPPRWFLLFMPEERTRGENKDGLFTIARATIANAKARAEVAHTTVVNAFGEGPVEQDLENLLAWLEMFHPKSYVELDYGGLAQYLNKALRDNNEDGLLSDTSIEDVLHSLSGLAAADGLMAGQGYERLMSRWRRVQALESAN